MALIKYRKGEEACPLEKLVTAPENTSLHDCNNIIWDKDVYKRQTMCPI